MVKTSNGSVGLNCACTELLTWMERVVGGGKAITCSTRRRNIWDRRNTEQRRKPQGLAAITSTTHAPGNAGEVFGGATCAASRCGLGLPYWMRSTTQPVASSALDYGRDGQALVRERLIRTAVWHVPATHDTLAACGPHGLRDGRLVLALGCRQIGTAARRGTTNPIDERGAPSRTKVKRRLQKRRPQAEPWRASGHSKLIRPAGAQRATQRSASVARRPWVLRSDIAKETGEMADGAGDELALTGQTGGANTTPEAASEQQIMLLQLQLKIAEAERERQRMELEIQRLQSHRSAEPGEVDSSFAVGAKADENRRLKFAGLFKGVLAPMPSQEALVPSWFDDVEATLESYEVPREWWAGLVLPRLSERARGLLTRLSSEERRDYAALKSKILDGLRLSAAEYKRLFSGSTKGAKETWEQFSVRLENYLDYYLESCKVSSLQEFKQLTVADRLRECLTAEARSHVILNDKPGFFTPSEVVKLAESYDESRKNRPVVVSIARAVASSQAKKANWDARIRKQCFKCHATGHIAKQCPTRETTEARLVKGTDRSVVARVAFPQYEEEAPQARIGPPKARPSRRAQAAGSRCSTRRRNIWDRRNTEQRRKPQGLAAITSTTHTPENAGVVFGGATCAASRCGLGLSYWMRSTTQPVTFSALDYGRDGQALVRERLIRTAVWHLHAGHTAYVTDVSYSPLARRGTTNPIDERGAPSRAKVKRRLQKWVITSNESKQPLGHFENEGPRTTNMVEGRHNGLHSRLTSHHPDLAGFVQCLQVIQHFSHNTTQALLLNPLAVASAPAVQVTRCNKRLQEEMAMLSCHLATGKRNPYLAALQVGLQIPATDRSAQGVANLARRFAWIFVDWPIATVCSNLDERLDETCRTFFSIENLIVVHINERFGHLLADMNKHRGLTLAKLELSSQARFELHLCSLCAPCDVLRADRVSIYIYDLDISSSVYVYDGFRRQTWP
ncbi:hypothetical protein HPB47_024603 [Ixodes persulcatus]|uniref:Uncharacterized protein n=1 Tax=Ixodes persulcatus TaxID=34615 RepID=A0AC60Q3W8_IXOPE|nr:hypothetical protein HPB47_024603 [Ixodes persulcatus]